MATTPFLPVDTAAVSWIDSSNNSNLRAYASDGYNVIERVYTSTGWQTTSFSQTGNAVTATAWTDSYGSHVRVYCTTAADTTTEWCLDVGGDWYQGQYTTS